MQLVCSKISAASIDLGGELDYLGGGGANY